MYVIAHTLVVVHNCDRRICVTMPWFRQFRNGRRKVRTPKERRIEGSPRRDCLLAMSHNHDSDQICDSNKVLRVLSSSRAQADGARGPAQT